MGFPRPRPCSDGTVRYLACYRDIKGDIRSAGTFASEREADKAWQRAEAEIARGRVGNPARGRIRFRRYVEDTWLPNHVIEATTRQNYTYSINRHIMPEFGDMRMIDIMPEHVRAWVTALRVANVRPPTIRYNKIILSAIFTTALNDQVIWWHPCKGVKTPPVPRKPLTIITPEQFDSVYQALPDADAQLLVETDIESGLRWGELTEFRVKDLDFQTHLLTVSRVVVEVNPRFHPEGKRFIVKEYPKDEECRQFKLSAQIVKKLEHHRNAKKLAPNDLLFAIRDQGRSRKSALRVAPDPDTLGLTSPNDKGSQYKHGSLAGYGAGKCRCDHCRAACAIYRAKRRAEGKDNPRTPRVRQTDDDGHISNDWFRRQVWYSAVKAAGLKNGVRVNDLRHAHASWLVAGGADLQVVKERLGHASITTTERYLHKGSEIASGGREAASRLISGASEWPISLRLEGF